MFSNTFLKWLSQPRRSLKKQSVLTLFKGKFFFQRNMSAAFWDFKYFSFANLRQWWLTLILSNKKGFFVSLKVASNLNTSSIKTVFQTARDLWNMTVLKIGYRWSLNDVGNRTVDDEFLRGGGYSREFWIGACREGSWPFLRPKPEKWHPIQGKNIIINSMERKTLTLTVTFDA